MTTPTADYAAAVTALRTQSLPAYVEYTQDGNARGLVGWRGTPARIVVDVRAQKIVSVTPSDKNSNGYDDSPVTRRMFDPTCYAATSERSTQWNDHDAIAIVVHKVQACHDDFVLNTVYVDAKTLELIGTDGSDTEDNMSVDISVQYARFATYIMPTAISAHAHGRGWLSWARERAELHYSNYVFTNVRRQTP